MRISDWSSDVCSSDLLQFDPFPLPRTLPPVRFPGRSPLSASPDERSEDPGPTATPPKRSRQNRSAAPGPSDLRCAEPAPGIDPEAGMTPEGERSARKSVVEGKSVSGRVELGGRRNIKKKKQ